jgi:hypothetical protein
MLLVFPQTAAIALVETQSLSRLSYGLDSCFGKPRFMYKGMHFLYRAQEQRLIVPPQ